MNRVLGLVTHVANSRLVLGPLLLLILLLQPQGWWKMWLAELRVRVRCTREAVGTILKLPVLMVLKLGVANLLLLASGVLLERWWLTVLLPVTLLTLF